MKLTESQLRKLIAETIEELNEESLAGEAAQLDVGKVAAVLNQIAGGDLPQLAKAIKDKLVNVQESLKGAGQGADSALMKRLEIAANAVNKLSDDLDVMTQKLGGGLKKVSQYVSATQKPKS